jgi:ubiquinone biosynthesis protein Coq4
MVKSGYDLNFINNGVVPINDIEYMMVRNSKAHDLHRMVTGFGPNPAGEQALALMNVAGNVVHFNPGLAQFLSLPNIFVTSGMMMRASLHYTVLPLLYQAMRLGTLAGEALKKPLIMVDWEDYLDWSLEDIAKDLGFERGPDERWSHSAELFSG